MLYMHTSKNQTKEAVSKSNPVPNASYNYLLEMTSATQTFSLPYTINNVTRLRIKTLYYTTVTPNQPLMTIRITGWDDYNLYFSNATVYPYTKAIFLPSTTGSQVIYENTSTYDDVVKQNAVGYLNNFRVEVLINGVSSSDISSSNPIYFELVFS